MNRRYRQTPAPRRLTSEAEIHWIRGAMIIAAMFGVVLCALVIWSLLQTVAPEKAQIHGLATTTVGAVAAAASPVAPAKATATASATPALSPTGVTATARGAPFVRNGPGITYPILTNLQNGESVPVIGRNPDSSWLQVMLASGERGWCSAALLTVSGNLPNVPVTQ